MANSRAIGSNGMANFGALLFILAKRLVVKSRSKPMNAHVNIGSKNGKRLRPRDL